MRIVNRNSLSLVNPILFSSSAFLASLALCRCGLTFGCQKKAFIAAGWKFVGFVSVLGGWCNSYATGSFRARICVRVCVLRDSHNRFYAKELFIWAQPNFLVLVAHVTSSIVGVSFIFAFIVAVARSYCKLVLAHTDTLTGSPLVNKKKNSSILLTRKIKRSKKSFQFW